MVAREERTAATVSLVAQDEHGTTVTVHRDLLARVGSRTPRFWTIQSLVQFVSTFYSMAQEADEEADLFLDLSRFRELGSSRAASSKGRHRQSLKEHLAFVGLEGLDQLLASELLCFDTRTYYPVLDDAVFARLLKSWLAERDARLERAGRAAFKQVKDLLEGCSSLPEAAVSLVSSADALVFLNEFKQQQIRGMHEFWELAQDPSNHANVSDALITIVMAVLEKADRGGLVQEYAAGTLQALAASDPLMRDRLDRKDVVVACLNCLRLGAGSPVQRPASRNIRFLFTAIAHLVGPTHAKQHLLSALPAFTVYLQPGAATEVVEDATMVLLRVFAEEVFFVEADRLEFAEEDRDEENEEASGPTTPPPPQSCRVQESLEPQPRRGTISSTFNSIGRGLERRLALSMQRAHLSHILVAGIAVSTGQMLEIFREMSHHSLQPDASFDLRLAATAVFCNFAAASEREAEACRNPTCPRRAESQIPSRAEEDNPPVLHGLRELMLCAKTIPLDMLAHGRWALAHVTASLLSGTSLPRDLNLLQALTSRTPLANQPGSSDAINGNGGPAAEATRPPEERAPLNFGLLDQHPFLNVHEDLMESVFRAAPSAAGAWALLQGSGAPLCPGFEEDELLRLAPERETMLPFILYNVCATLCEWAAALAQERTKSAHRFVRFRAYSVISDREVESAFAVLAHVLGFLQQGWVDDYCAGSSQLPVLRSLLAETARICAQGMADLLSVPQQAAALVYRFTRSRQQRDGRRVHRTPEHGTRKATPVSDVSHRRWGLRCARRLDRDAPRFAADASDDMALGRTRTYRPSRARCDLDLGAARAAREPQGCRRACETEWARAPLLASFELGTADTAAAETAQAVCLLNVLLLGPAGHEVVSRELGLSGLMSLFESRSVRFEREAKCANTLAGCVLLFSYGPVGLNADLDVVDRRLPLLGSRKEDPIELSKTGHRPFATCGRLSRSSLSRSVKVLRKAVGEMGRGVLSAPRKAPSSSLLCAPKVLCRWASNVAMLAMAQWCMAREKSNCTSLLLHTPIVQTLAEASEVALQMLKGIARGRLRRNQSRAERLASEEDTLRKSRALRQRTRRTINRGNFRPDFQHRERTKTVSSEARTAVQQGMLDVLEATTCALWLMIWQRRASEQVLEDMLLYKTLPTAFEVLAVLRMIIAGDHERGRKDCNDAALPRQRQRVIMQTLSLVWTAIEVHDRLFALLLRPSAQWMLNLLRQCCYDARLDSQTRRQAMIVFSNVARNANRVLQRIRDRENAMSIAKLGSNSNEELSNRSLLNMSLDLLDEKDPNLRSVGALIIARTKLSIPHHRLIQSSGKILPLIVLATQHSEYERRCALLALLNCADSAVNQELIARDGLYRLLISSWTCADTADRQVLQHLTSVLLSKLARNYRNRTRVYEAELRAKEIAGWCRTAQKRLAQAQACAANRTAKPAVRSAAPTRGQRHSHDETLRAQFLEWAAELEAADEEALSAKQSAEAREGAKASEPTATGQGQDQRQEAGAGNHVDAEAFEHVQAPHQSPLWKFREAILPCGEPSTFSEQNATMEAQILHDLEVMRSAVLEQPSVNAGQASGPGTGEREVIRPRRGSLRDDQDDHYVFDRKPEEEDWLSSCSDLDSEEEEETASQAQRSLVAQKRIELEKMRAIARDITHKNRPPEELRSPHLPFSATFKLKPGTALVPPKAKTKTSSPRKVLLRAPHQQQVVARTATGTIATRVGSASTAEPHSQHSPFTRAETQEANALFGQRMRQPAKALWEGYKTERNPWKPRVNRITRTTVEVEKASFSFAGKDVGGEQTRSARKGQESETPREFLDRHMRRARRKKRDKGFLQKSALALFPHVPGSRIFRELPVYEAPIGNEGFMYFQGEENTVAAFLDERDFGLTEMPSTILALGRVKLDAEAVEPSEGKARQQEWRDIVAGVDFGPGAVPPQEAFLLSTTRLLPMAAVVDALPGLASIVGTTRRAGELRVSPRVRPLRLAGQRPAQYSQESDTPVQGADILTLQRAEQGQPETGVRWDRDGVIVDDTLVMVVRSPGRLREMVEEHLRMKNAPPLVNPNLVFTAFKGRRAYLDESPVGRACVAHDWDLCMKKPGFREFVGGFDKEQVASAKAMAIKAAPLLVSVYRFYCALSPQNPFALLNKAYIRFVEDIRLLDRNSSVRTLRESCQNLFIRLSSETPVDKLTPAMMSLNERCDPLGLKKSRRLMRHEFLEILLRLAHLKYFESSGNNFAEAFEALLKLNVIRNLGPETVLDFDAWRIRRLYNKNVSDLFIQHKPMLEAWFIELAGRDRRSVRWGGAEKQRMAIAEWNMGLRSVGLFTANFTIRESTFAFVMSTTHVVDWVKNWQQVLSLTYPDFLEALGRVTELVVIPTREQLAFFGVDNIVQFYTLMERTNLWGTLDHSTTDAETRLSFWMTNEEQQEAAASSMATNNRPPVDERTLSEKLRQFLALLAARQRLEKMRESEIKFWHDRRKRTDIRRRQARSNGTPPSTPQRKNRASIKELEARDFEAEDMLDMESDINNVSNDLESFEISTATQLHEIWRSQRNQRPDGSYEPRIKLINGKQYDIANLVFKDLPDYFKLENLLAAHCACESIRRCWAYIQEEDPKKKRELFAQTLRSTDFLEQASEEQHIFWLKRNGKHEWVSEEQRLPYRDLSEPEKQKDRVIVLAAIEVYLMQQSRNGDDDGGEDDNDDDDDDDE